MSTWKDEFLELLALSWCRCSVNPNTVLSAEDFKCHVLLHVSAQMKRLAWMFRTCFCSDLISSCSSCVECKLQKMSRPNFYGHFLEVMSESSFCGESISWFESRASKWSGSTVCCVQFISRFSFNYVYPFLYSTFPDTDIRRFPSHSWVSYNKTNFLFSLYFLQYIIFSFVTFFTVIDGFISPVVPREDHHSRHPGRYSNDEGVIIVWFLISTVGHIRSG